ncbi:hypothetical protein CY34DRAFT_770493, partial [Suillus luteus UH-Slu-Lm8-n1]
ESRHSHWTHIEPRPLHLTNAHQSFLSQCFTTSFAQISVTRRRSSSTCSLRLHPPCVPASSRATSLWYHYLADDVEERRAALKRCPPGHSDRSSSLNNLVVSLGDRFT